MIFPNSTHSNEVENHFLPCLSVYLVPNRLVNCSNSSNNNDNQLTFSLKVFSFASFLVYYSLWKSFAHREGEGERQIYKYWKKISRTFLLFPKDSAAQYITQTLENHATAYYFSLFTQWVSYVWKYCLPYQSLYLYLSLFLKQFERNNDFAMQRFLNKITNKIKNIHNKTKQSSSLFS